MFDAAVESAHIFNRAVCEVAHTSGLLELLTDARSVDAVVSRMRFQPERGEQVGHLLRLLVAEGALEERDSGGTPVFRTVSGVPARLRDAPDNGRYRPRSEAIAEWFGDGHADNIRASNKGLLGPDLGFLRSKTAAVEFNAAYERAWRTNLENPLYEFGRLACVRELVARGNRFLDLACGPGYGARRLAELSRGPCEIVGVDKSRDFLASARSGWYPGARTTFIERDLNTGLPPLRPGAFDGILFNGAFHFIADKRSMLRSLWRVLRPGGLLAIGHCFSRSGFADERMHDFYFSLLADRSFVLPWSRLQTEVVDAGFALTREFHRGSHSYLLAERTSRPPEPAGAGAP
jgi:SAM-dependent methyltransferase